MMDPDTWVPINAACKQFGLSRRGFYRMLEDNPELESDGIVMRVPPVTGNRKVGLRAMESWLRKRNGIRVVK